MSDADVNAQRVRAVLHTQVDTWKTAAWIIRPRAASIIAGLFNFAATATPFFIMRRKLLELYPQFVAKEDWG